LIKSFTAATREIDDARTAIAEPKSALNLEKNVLKNSVGIISYFPEFEDTGVLKAICAAMPFDCIGATTCLCASGKDADQILFAITVFTSDDCSFKTEALDIAGDYSKNIKRDLKVLLEKEKPALFLSYFPLMQTVSGDMIFGCGGRSNGR